MVYSWGLFLPRHSEWDQNLSISPRALREKTGKRASEIADLDRITTSLNEKEKMILATHSAYSIHPSDPHHFIFSPASSVYMCRWGCVGAGVRRCSEGSAATLDVDMNLFTVCKVASQMMLPIWIGQELAERLWCLCVTENTVQS